MNLSFCGHSLNVKKGYFTRGTSYLESRNRLLCKNGYPKEAIHLLTSGSPNNIVYFHGLPSPSFYHSLLETLLQRTLSTQPKTCDNPTKFKPSEDLTTMSRTSHKSLIYRGDLTSTNHIEVYPKALNPHPTLLMLSTSSGKTISQFLVSSQIDTG